MTHYCPASYHEPQSIVSYTDKCLGEYDVVVTDAWPAGFEDQIYSLSLKRLASVGNPLVLPTPPVSVGKELAQSLTQTPKFVGYQQKGLLLPVQKAIISYLLQSRES